DANGTINYSEFGVYTQIQKELELNENLALKLTGSVRYDKSEFFKGFVSPRISAGLTVNENHNIRASYQTGFRNPTTQDLFIGLNAGPYVLIGSAPDNLNRDVRTYPVSASGQLLGQPSSVTLTGAAAYGPTYSSSSVQAGAPVVSNIEVVKPEQVSSFEVG